MKTRFKEWRVDFKWVTLFPHIDDFNARERGQNFLGSVSRTVDGDSPSLGLATKRRLTITFCQQKVHEDTQVREICASKTHKGMRQWTTSLPKQRTDCNILEFAKYLHQGEIDVQVNS
jgi:hypothetical protein